MEELLTILRPDEAYFWGTHAGAEIDLLLFKEGRRIGVVIKRADAPRLTPSIRIALTDLGLNRLLVIYPGEKRYSLAEKVDVLPLSVLSAEAMSENPMIRPGAVMFIGLSNVVPYPHSTQKATFYQSGGTPDIDPIVSFFVCLF